MEENKTIIIEKKETVAGTLSATFGIIGLVLDFCCLAGLPFSVAGLILGIVGLKKSTDKMQKNLSIIGTATSAIGLLVFVGLVTMGIVYAILGYLS